MTTMQPVACAWDVCFEPDRSTGKERDTESGNDYFEARYYSSAMGRFMSPDSGGGSPVPYASFDDPQSLNLYSYMRNNPLGGTDPNGHCDIGCQIGIALGIVNGIARDGGVGPYTRNAGVGALKGVGQAGYMALSLATSGGNPGAFAASMLSQPAGLSASNTTQAQYAYLASTTVTVAASAPAAIETESVAISASIAEESLSTAAAGAGGRVATMVGACDVETGNVAVGASGPVSRLGAINPHISAAADQVGGIGAVNPGAPSPVGCCAEVDAANQLTNQGSNLQNVRFTDAIRPRTGAEVPKCTNCQGMFPNQ
jgi:RHS repeat-associated protein